MRCAVFLLILAAMAPAFAQTPPRPGPNTRLLDRLERMTPSERQRVLDRLPPGRRANIERKLSRYESLSPEQRDRVRRNFERFRSLPPERQEAARRLFARLQRMPRDRRPVMREELRALRRLSPADRESRLDGFAPAERQWLRDALSEAPTQVPEARHAGR